MKIKALLISGIVVLSLFLYACTTEKNTAVTRFYHNTTARFNVFFNGNESLKQAQEKIDALPDNYTILLPVYKAEKEEAAPAVSGETERAVLKAVKLIDRHSITVKPERKDPKGSLSPEERKKREEFYNKPEYNNWVDDAYLNIGKAHYYQHDYRTGMKSLQLIINKFRKEEIRFDAMYWIARSYSALGNLKDAESYLQKITESKDYPKKRLQYDIDLAYVDIYIKQKKYEKALTKLNKLIPETKKRKKRARLQYLAAQLYGKTKQNKKALAAYNEVIKMNPPYEMAFSAKVNLAKSFSGSEDSERLKKIYYKMLKDDKNIEYQDQIYYALAEIDMKSGDTTAAKKNYVKSTEKSMGNMDQKALSFLALADLYFAEPDYINAGAYYDSTMSVLDKEHPEYQSISRKAENLSGLTDNIRTVIREDSLRRVAQMDSAERLIYIEQIIADVKAQEAAEKNRQNNLGRDEFSPNQIGGNTKGKWYFYNPQALSVGRNEFKKMWGNRKLEDHWRRKNKAIIAGNNNSEDSDTTNRVTDNKKPEFYLQDLPLNDSLMQASHDRTAKALFNTGLIYERKMEDYPEAEKAYLELLKRYPEHTLVVEALFNLYLMNFKILNNKSKAEEYRQRILKDFPTSKYAGILTDPDYMKKLEKTKDRINRIYADAYQAYKDEDYETVIAKAEESREVFEQNNLAAKFLYLESMAYGNKGNTEKMKSGLEKLVKNYPDDEVNPKAKKVIAVIESGLYDPNYYSYTESGEFYYIIISEDNTATFNQVKFKLASFNVRVFPDKSLNVNKRPFTPGKMQIVVQSMDGKSQAVTYYNRLKDEELLSEIDVPYQDFVISKENFEKLQKLKYPDKYIRFFNEHFSL